jgi:hypothetical protein
VSNVTDRDLSDLPDNSMAMVLFYDEAGNLDKAEITTPDGQLHIGRATTAKKSFANPNHKWGKDIPTITLYDIQSENGEFRMFDLNLDQKRRCVYYRDHNGDYTSASASIDIESVSDMSDEVRIARIWWDMVETNTWVNKDIPEIHAILDDVYMVDKTDTTGNEDNFYGMCLNALTVVHLRELHAPNFTGFSPYND